jgi:O-antigen/teichoic acid export membrane protein
VAAPGDSRAGRNFGALALGQLLARLLAFFTTAYLARVLGPEGFGVVGFAYALTGYFALAVSAGLNTVGATHVAEDRDRATAVAADVMGVRILLATVAFALSALLAAVLPKPAAVKWVIVLTGLTYFTRAVSTEWVHKGLERNQRVARSLVLTEVVQISLVLALVGSDDDVLRVPLALFLAQVASAGYLLVPLVREGLPKPDLARGLAIFRGAFSLTLTKLMRTALYTMDVLFIGFLLGERAVGLYDAPGRIGLFVVALSGSLVFSFLPDFARAREAGTGPSTAVLARALGFAFFMIAPLLAGGLLVAEPLLVALFGAPYGEGAVVLKLVLARVSLIFFRDTLESVLVVYRRLTPEMWVMAAATVLAVVLNVVLIPRLGIDGAALATLVTEVAVVGGQIALVRRQGVGLRIPLALRIVGATGVMAGVVALLLGRLPVLLVVLLGTAVYGAAAFLLGAIPDDVRTMLAKPPGPGPSDGPR